jgi:hypothetical protein
MQNKKGEGKMKKFFVFIAVVALVALFAIPAMARHDRPEKNFAKADVDVSQEVEHQDFDGGYKFDPEGKIDGCFNHFVGIAQVNQSAGSGNNQANAVAAAVTQFNERREEAVGKSLAFIDVDQEAEHNDVRTGYRSEYKDRIEGSFNRMEGIAQVNQAAGFGNNQSNAVAIAANVGTDGAKAIADTDLEQQNSHNDVHISARTSISAKMEGSFNHGVGVAQVNQSPGSLNNQSNSVSISYAGFEAHH